MRRVDPVVEADKIVPPESIKQISISLYIVAILDVEVYSHYIITLNLLNKRGRMKKLLVFMLLVLVSVFLSAKDSRTKLAMEVQCGFGGGINVVGTDLIPDR